MKLEAFSGPIKKCWEDLLARSLASGKRDFIEGKIAELISIPKGTIVDWRKLGTMPNGVNMMKLNLLLAYAGYEVEEFIRLTPTQKMVLSLVATNVMDTNSLAKKTGVGPNTVLRWGNGSVTPLGDRKKALEKIKQEYAEPLNKALATWSEGLRLIGLGPTVPVIVDQKEATAKPTVNQKSHQEVVNFLGHMIMALVPLAKLALSEEFSSDERKQLRDMTANGQSHGVFELSNLLNRLCGERARKDLR